MLDLSASDYGTYYELTVPEPETPLTVGWGSCMAKNVAKITKCLVNTQTNDLGSMGTYEISMSAANFFDIPFSKLYSNTVFGWTDNQSIGTGNNLLPDVNALNTVFKLDRVTPGTCRLLIGTNTSYPIPSITQWLLIQYGK